MLLLLTTYLGRTTKIERETSTENNTPLLIHLICERVFMPPRRMFQERKWREIQIRNNLNKKILD